MINQPIGIRINVCQVHLHPIIIFPSLCAVGQYQFYDKLQPVSNQLIDRSIFSVIDDDSRNLWHGNTLQKWQTGQSLNIKTTKRLHWCHIQKKNCTWEWTKSRTRLNTKCPNKNKADSSYIVWRIKMKRLVGWSNIKKVSSLKLLYRSIGVAVDF